MASWRDFGATNDADTCLWCGKRLRQPMTDKERPADEDFHEWIKRPASERTEPRYAKRGDYGDGHFCGLRCAYQFAVALADLGKRLTTR